MFIYIKKCVQVFIIKYANNCKQASAILKVTAVII